MMRTSTTERKSWADKWAACLLALTVIICVAALVAGCGLQTEEASKDLGQATKHQEEAEAIMARFKAFPADWQTVFTAPRSAAQIESARQLLKAREDDVTAFKAALAAWRLDLRKIDKLNVGDAIKEYVKLKVNSVDCYSEYVTAYLAPVFKSYEGLVEQIAFGRPQAELDKTASEITGLVKESSSKLEECRAAQKQADDFFQKSKLGS